MPDPSFDVVSFIDGLWAATWARGNCPHCGSVSIEALDSQPAFYSCRACGKTSNDPRPGAGDDDSTQPSQAPAR